MQKASEPRSGWWQVLLFLVASLVVATDQLSKVWVRAYPEGYDIFQAGFFGITHIRNTGAAFGLFPGHSPLLAVVASLSIILLLAYALIIYRHYPLFCNGLGGVALGLILGGATGNLIDRLRFGEITDFIDFTVWPAFNIADSALTIGAMLVIYLFFRLARVEKR
jgi:signal peptidase II